MKTIMMCAFVLALVACNASDDEQADQFGSQLGNVQIAASCSKQANQHLQRGLALLHHMTYEGARAAFLSASDIDTECSLAYWGHAMTFIHPLWSDPPSEADFKQGQTLLEQARKHAKNNKHELAYIAAAEAYYLKGRNSNETANLASFAQAWEEVYRRFPSDIEAASFYALALMSTAEPTDKTFSRQKEAGAIVEKVLSQNPQHPGAHHYIVHAYDSPPLAEKALEVANRYGKIAPDIPHALHMPTHIFTRLGYWQESIDMNRRSAAAALEHPAGEQLSMHYLHALDYLAYAHLQRAEDAKALEVLRLVEQINGPVQPHVASAYALAAVPARVVLERQQWSDAAMLKLQQPANFLWAKFPAMEAIIHFARALGAARTGQVEIAAKSLDSLSALYDQTADTSAYWAKQIEIQRLSAQAWLIYEEGQQDEALEVMRMAAELESSTEKHPVTPGEVLPARELFADMLLEMGQYEEAQTEYETALARSPRRFNSLYGAGRAAELIGDKKKAAVYYGKLVQISGDAERQRPRLEQARAFLNES